MIDRRGHHSVLALPALPSPLHFLAGVLAWDALSWGERLSVLADRRRPSVRLTGSPTLQLGDTTRQIGSSLAGAERPGAEAMRAVLGAAGPGRAQPVDRSGRSLALHPRARARVRARSRGGRAGAAGRAARRAVRRAGARVARRSRQRGARQRAGESGHRWPARVAAFACATR